MRNILLAATLLVAVPMAQQAHAATITVGGPLTLLSLGYGGGGGLVNSNPIAFDHGSISFTPDLYDPKAGLYSGSVSVAKSPFLDTRDYLVAQAGDPATISFAGLQTKFGLLWGTVDTYNELDFYNDSVSSSVPVYTISGGGLPLPGNFTYGTDAAYVTISGIGPFDRVVAVDYGQPAFEFAIDPVPEPRGISLLGLGIVTLGTIREIRRNGGRSNSVVG
jgi:hypothetical protein